MISGPESSYEEVCSFRWKPLESEKTCWLYHH